jgi:hypothetical protein
MCDVGRDGDGFLCFCYTAVDELLLCTANDVLCLAFGPPFEGTEQSKLCQSRPLLPILLIGKICGCLLFQVDCFQKHGVHIHYFVI